MKTALILLATVLCAGCEVGIPQSSEESCFNTVVFENRTFIPKLCAKQKDWNIFAERNFNIQIPGQLFKLSSSEGIPSFSTKFTNRSNTPDDYSISFSKNTPDCEKLAKGEWTLDPIAPQYHLLDYKVLEQTPSSVVVWGKQDMESLIAEFHSEDCGSCPVRSEEPECKSCWDKIWARGWEKHQYLLCASGHDNTNLSKGVLITLTQQTDNPELAEDIFKTFRWTE